MKTPPIAAQKEFAITLHHQTISDPWHWLRDPGYPEVKDPEILDYLNAENEWFETFMTPHKALINDIFTEIKGRIKEDDSSVPVRDGTYDYYWRFEKGAQYRQWYRTSARNGATTCFLDEAKRASGAYYKCRAYDISENEALLAWSEDTDGSERFNICIGTIGEEPHTVITNTSGVPIWVGNQAVLYVELNQNLRPFRVRLHRLNAPDDDSILYEEKDDSFFTGIAKTRSKDFILFATGDHITSEIRVLPTHNPTAEPVMVAPRKSGHEYDITHAGGHFYIRTNDQHKNFRVVKASIDAPQQENWEEVIAASDDNYIHGISGFADFLVVEERVEGLDQIRVHNLGGQGHHIVFPEASYAASLGNTPEYKSAALRIHYDSMVSPATVYDYDLAKRQLITRKVQEIPSGYDAKDYITERLMIDVRDGTRVPVSIVYRKDFKKDGMGKLHLYGYGAYGLGMEPHFSGARLSLLNRGFAYAIAHIRGGDEMGYHWYEDGKLNKRTNTFHDFIDVAKGLVDMGYTKVGRISASGGSAGGSLMGYIANEAPDLFHTIVAHVPFVDILNTMIDESLPLTPMEWPEWGNPITDEAAFNFIRAYSPYDNVRAQNYPHLLITAGLNDPRVTYWEPAKWTAKLRVMKTDNNPLLLKTNMGAGHGGKSGRFEGLHEVAEEYAFILVSFAGDDEVT